MFNQRGASGSIVWGACAVLFAAALLIGTTGFSSQAYAQEKVALVVGNSKYQKVLPLTNPANDAADMASSLRRLGFSVTHLSDLDFNGFRRALIDFSKSAQNSDMAVFFYAGHGAEIDGKNWLIPVDAEIKSQVNVYAEAINLETLIDISVMPKMIGLVILDACRNNPFLESIAAEGRSLSLSASSGSIPVTQPNPAAAAAQPIPNAKEGVSIAAQLAEPVDPSATGNGLAPVEPADNVLVAFSAAAGTTANDGQGRNSPYSTALLRHVETPGLEVNYLFRDVYDDVVAETKTQQPALYGTLSKDEVYLKPGDARALLDADEEAEAEKLTWPFIQATNDIATLRRFVEKFPRSARLGEVRNRITQLEGAETFAWRIVERQNTAAAYRAFAELYPESERAETARVMMTTLEAASPGGDTGTFDLPKPPAKGQLAAGAVSGRPVGNGAQAKAWEVLGVSNDQDIVARFTERFPNSRRRARNDYRVANPTQWMLNTANDSDVNNCFGGSATACLTAMEKYPDFVQLRFQLCRTARADRKCMEDAVQDAREEGYLVSAYTRSTTEKSRNEQFRRVQQQAMDAASRAASQVASQAASAAAASAAAAASSAAAAAAANAANSAAARAASNININVATPVIPVIAAPVIRVPSAGRFTSQVTALRTNLAPAPSAAPATPAVRALGPAPTAPAARVAPTPSAPAVAVQTPAAKVPTVATPSVRVNTNVPNVKVNAPNVPNVKVNAPNVPNVRVPTVNPKVNVPNVKVNVAAPNVKVNVPQVRVPQVKTPAAPSISAPTVRVPTR